MIAEEIETDESESSSSECSILDSIMHTNIKLEKKVNVSYVTRVEENNIYLNQKKDECLICYKEMKNDVVCINNNYCKCFFNVFLRSTLQFLMFS